MSILMWAPFTQSASYRPCHGRPCWGVQDYRDYLRRQSLRNSYFPVQQLMEELMEDFPFLENETADDEQTECYCEGMSDCKNTTTPNKSSQNASESPEKFQLHFDVSGFRPGEVKIKAKDENFIEIQAKCEKASESGLSYKEYHRSVQIPEHVDAKSLKSVLTPEGILKIEEQRAIQETSETKQTGSLNPIQAETVPDNSEIKDNDESSDVKADNKTDSTVTNTTEMSEGNDGSISKLSNADAAFEESFPSNVAETNVSDGKYEAEVMEVTDIPSAENDDQDKCSKTNDENVEDDKESSTDTDSIVKAEQFMLEFDVSEFKPEEIKVKTTDENYLEITAEHEAKSEYGHIYKKYHRTVKIPEDTDANSLKSVLSPEGILTIAAPVKVEAIGGPIAEQKMDILHE